MAASSAVRYSPGVPFSNPRWHLLYAVHTALQAPASVVDKYKNKPVGKYHTNPVYAAMIEKLDDGVGKICRAIQEMGIEENTIIIFYSDNGGSEPVTDNYPLHVTYPRNYKLISNHPNEYLNKVAL